MLHASEAAARVGMHGDMSPWQLSGQQHLTNS